MVGGGARTGAVSIAGGAMEACMAAVTSGDDEGPSSGCSRSTSSSDDFSAHSCTAASSCCDEINWLSSSSLDETAVELVLAARPDSHGLGISAVEMLVGFIWGRRGLFRGAGAGVVDLGFSDGDRSELYGPGARELSGPRCG